MVGKMIHSGVRAAFVAGLSVLVAGPGPVAAYVFAPVFEGPGVRAEIAGRWRAEVWAPGETLVWDLAVDESDFRADGVVSSPEEALRFVESALAAWSGIPTADISWRAQLVPKGPERAKDGRNTIWQLGETWAGVEWNRSASGEWEIVGCDVPLEVVGGPEPEVVGYPGRPEIEWSERNWIHLTHEFGHCLGLEHSQVSALYRFLDESAPLAAWRDPLMSYGRQDFAPELTADDRIGASLLRPDPAWSARVGSISGTLRMEGEPVPYSAVWAVRRDGGEARYAVGTFSDLEGGFTIEGLEAGDYTLWAHGVVVPRAHPSHWAVGPTDLGHTILPRVFRVRAGREIGGVVIPMWRRE